MGQSPLEHREQRNLEGTGRAVMLSILCSLGLILVLALLGWFYLPRSAQMAGAGGSGGGTGTGTGMSENAGNGGSGGMGGGGAGGTSGKGGSGGDAQGDSKASGTGAVASNGNGAAIGAPLSPEKPEGLPGAETAVPVAETRSGTVRGVKVAATPPPLPSQSPGTEPQVMALGNLKFTDKSASASAGLPRSGRRKGEPVLGTGDVQITLRWQGAPDVDLHVRDPNGDEIWYQQKTSQSKGTLDVDDTDGEGPENVFWPTGGAPKGDYEVSVVLYKGRSATWTVRVLVDGREQHFSGTLSGTGSTKLVTKFKR